METKKTGQDKWEMFRKAILESRREETFRNITPQWIEFLKKDKNIKTNSFLLWIIGSRGSGKTAEVLKITNIMLKDNPKRVVQFWQAHQDLIDFINKVCPREYVGRFETIFKLKQIKRNSIFCIDEGLLGANAKEALRTEMKNLVKFLSKSRHYNIIGIINSVSFGILLEFKNVVDMVMYKRLPRSLIRNNKKDFILKDYPDKILKLKDWENILVSNYKRFDKTGIVSWKYENYCPWFSKNISMYQKNTSPDVDFDETTRLLKVHSSIVKWTIDAVGSDFIGKGGYRNFRMWFYTNHTDVYQDNIKQLKTIHDLYSYTLSIGCNNGVNSTVLSIDGWELVDFIFRYTDNDVLDKIKVSEIKKSVFKELRDGALQKNLALKYNTTQKTISEWNSEVRGAFSDKVGELFEKEYRNYLKRLKIYKKDKPIRNGASGRPDILLHKLDTDELHVYSCKTINKRPRNILKKYLTQEYDTALREEPNYKKVRLFLTVLVRSENKTYQKELNYRNLTNVLIK